MAWNPTKEVAVARDAAKALGDAPICVVLYVTKDANQIGIATYGKTKELCAFAAGLGEHVFAAAKQYGDD